MVTCSKPHREEDAGVTWVLNWLVTTTHAALDISPWKLYNRAICAYLIRMPGETNGKHIIGETLWKPKSATRTCSVCIILKSLGFKLAHVLARVTGKSKASKAGLRAGGRLRWSCQGFLAPLLAPPSPALAASPCRLFLVVARYSTYSHSGERRTVSWVPQLLFQGHISLCHMPILEPITGIRGWGDVLIGFSLGHLPTSRS